jgi:sulfoxide reductase heme-binding subunit YedZ
MTNWNLLRAAGIGAYLMLFLSVAWGLLATTAVVTKHVSKPTSTLFHQFTATVGMALLAVHVFLLVIDRFMPFNLADVLVPMHSSFRPVAITMGVVAMYGAVVVLVSSWLRKPIGPKLWRALHLMAVPAFTLALAHGVFAGTDTVRTWMWAMYAATGLSVVFLVIVRGLSYGYRPPRPPAPERARKPVAASVAASPAAEVSPAVPAASETAPEDDTELAPTAAG